MKKHICRGRCAFYDCKSVLLVTDVLFLGGIEEEVADGSNEGVNTKSDVSEKEIRPRSGGKAFGLQLGVVDDDASDKAEEEGKQKARAAFEKVTVSLETILDAIKAQEQSAQWTKDNGQFIPHPATWLNGKRWEDQVKAAGSSRTNCERRLDEDEIASIKRMMEAPDFDDIPQEVF